MSKIIFSIRDKKMNTHMVPMFSNHLTETTRQLTEVAADPKSSLAKYPEDFELWKHGFYDEANGKFTLLDEPIFILNTSELIQPKETNEHS